MLLLMRSLQFVPANRERFVESAHNSPADVIVLDLEDSVPPAEKEAARSVLATAIPSLKAAGKTVHVRINNIETGLDFPQEIDALNEQGAKIKKLVWLRGNTKKNGNGYLSFIVVSENELLAQIALEEEILNEKLETAKDKIDAGMTSLLEQQSKIGRPDVDQRLGVALARMCREHFAIDRFDGQALGPDRAEARVDELLGVGPVVLGRIDRGRGGFGRGRVAADGGRIVDRGKVVRRRIAIARRRFVAQIALDVRPDIAAAGCVALHRSLLASPRCQCPVQTGARLSLKAAIPSA